VAKIGWGASLAFRVSRREVREYHSVQVLDAVLDLCNCRLRQFVEESLRFFAREKDGRRGTWWTKRASANHWPRNARLDEPSISR